MGESSTVTKRFLGRSDSVGSEDKQEERPSLSEQMNRENKKENKTPKQQPSALRHARTHTGYHCYTG